MVTYLSIYLYIKGLTRIMCYAFSVSEISYYSSNERYVSHDVPALSYQFGFYKYDDATRKVQLNTLV